MPKRNQPPGDVASAPDAELDVLFCLWRRGSATIRELRDALSGERPMKHASVGTLLHRLEARGLVCKEKAPVGKAYVYRPASRPTTGYRQIVRRFLRRVFGGDSVALVTSLLESAPPSSDQLEALRKLLDDAGEHAR